MNQNKVIIYYAYKYTDHNNSNKIKIPIEFVTLFTSRLAIWKRGVFVIRTSDYMLHLKALKPEF